MHFGKGRRVANMQKHSLLKYDPTDNWLLLHAKFCWDKREGGRNSKEWKPRQTDFAEKMHTRPQAQLRNALNTIDCRVVLQRKSNTVWFVSVVLSATYHRWKSANIIHHFLLSILALIFHIFRSFSYMIWIMDISTICHPGAVSLFFCSWPKRAKSKVFQKVCKSRQILITRLNSVY